MSEITDFAGLTALEVGEEQDEAFLFRNIVTIDQLLKVGAVLHRHDAHAAIVDPPQDDDTGPVVAVDLTGGTIPADLGIYVGYTYLDAQGGESIMSDVTLATTPPPMDPPIDAPTAEVDTTAGGLLADTYSYAVTVTDGLGGETLIGPSVEATVDPGFANAQITLGGLAALLADAGGTEWRLYRARGAGNYVFLAQGATDTITDDDTLCPNCDQEPPESSTTASANRLRVTLPAGPLPTGVEALRLYASVDGAFEGECLLGQYPAADAGTEQTFTTLTLLPGAPPSVNLSIPGANKIDPDTELVDWHWKRPVATIGDLPTTGNEPGDVRMTLDTFQPRYWDGDTWELWDIGGNGHVVINPAGAAMTQRSKLKFTGANVSVTDSAGTDETVVNVAPLDHEGEWDIATAYTPGQVVTASGSSYIAVAATTGNDPASDDGTHWLLLAAKGADGADGTDGAPGASGLVGIWRGAWVSTTAYVATDVVRRNGSSYIAVASTTGDDPDIDDGSNWALVAEKGDAGADGALPGRGDVAGTVAGLAASAEGNLTLALGKGYTLYKIVTNRPARVRLYANAAYRTADASRAIGTDPTGDHGLLMEIITTSGQLSYALAPPVDGYNLETVVTTDAPLRITNMDTVTGDVTVTLTRIVTEA